MKVQHLTFQIGLDKLVEQPTNNTMHYKCNIEKQLNAKYQKQHFYHIGNKTQPSNTSKPTVKRKIYFFVKSNRFGNRHNDADIILSKTMNKLNG